MHAEDIKVVPRGAGTGLSGGALPLNDAILLSLGKFNKIIEIDFENKCVSYTTWCNKFRNNACSTA